MSIDDINLWAAFAVVVALIVVILLVQILDAIRGVRMFMDENADETRELVEDVGLTLEKIRHDAAPVTYDEHGYEN